MADVYDKRATEAENARKNAQDAAAFVSRTLALDGLSDPGYVANILEEELERFEDDPNAELIDMPWTGEDIVSGMTMERMLDLTSSMRPPAGSSDVANKAAISTAIRVVRAFSRPDDIVEFLENAPHMIASILTSDTAQSRCADVEAALREIQVHRRLLGMRPLDTASAGWTEQDVIDEADRISRLQNPLQDLKHMLM